MKNVIFWHICGIDHYKKIVDDQFLELNKSCLINNIDNIYVTYLGESKNDLDFLLSRNKKIKLIDYNSNFHLYEKICIDNLLNWSQTNNANVLYIHAKGVSRKENSNIWNWRKLLEYFLIVKYKECINKLENYDVIGNLLLNGGKKDTKIKDENHCYHLSGNFWWSKTQYIKNLPPIPNINMATNKNFWLCERWILYPYPNVKLFLMYDHKTKHYYDFSPDLKSIIDEDRKKKYEQ